MGGHIVSALSDRVSTDLAHFGDHPLRDITGPQLTAIVIGGVQLIALVVGPIGLVTMAAGVGTHGFQGGWNFAPEALQLNWSRLNPGQGVKRFNFIRSGADTLKSLVGVALVAWLGWGATRAVVLDTPPGLRGRAGAAPRRSSGKSALPSPSWPSSTTRCSATG
jgi:flagellar biosynthesis protein FlhB